MALKKQATPKRWRSKEAKEIVAAVQRAGGQVERTASGHLKVIGPDRFRHRRLSPQHRPHRWAGRPQHPGHDQKQDRARGVKKPGRAAPPGCLNRQPRNRCPKRPIGRSRDLRRGVVQDGLPGHLVAESIRC